MSEAGEAVGIYKGFLLLDKDTKGTSPISVIFSKIRFVEFFSEDS